MSILAEKVEAVAMEVACTEDELGVVLSDGRTITVPLAWFPRLLGASTEQRAHWELIGGGVGIHWEAVDEDISVASLLQPENFMRLPENALQPASRARRRAKGREPVRAALKRAPATFATQREAGERAKQLHSDDRPDAERVRHTSEGGQDRSRSSRR